MPRRVLAALAVALTASVVALPAAAEPVAAHAVVAAPPTVPDDSVVDNPFVPDDRNLSECISAMPQPGCGSEARGGWRQLLVFLVVLVGLAFVGWQITRTVRRNRRLQDEQVDAPAGRHGP
jgi:hypothetical protein